MGRPRIHDDATASLLLDAAEDLVSRSGPDALSIRSLAAATATSTRAVYSTFGSKRELLAALARRAFAFLDDGVSSLPATADPASDLVAAGLVFRRLAVERTALFLVAFHDRDPAETAWPEVRPAQQSALAALRTRIERVLPEADARAIRAHAFTFHALCEGLASLQLRGAPVHSAWEPALRTLVDGITLARTAPARDAH